MIPKAEVIIIRCLGFQALRLKHACCIEINSLFWFNEDLKGKDDDEIEEILDEQKWGYQALEILMQEFQSQFDTLELPLWEFLTTHWQPRMIEYLSQRDSYNQKHHEETRKLGVLLEPAGNDIPDWLYYFGNKVEEL
ncbi:hypothetical protein N7456_012086 [Penicillium angulare]|uniref:Uncharacterized protein n=1 Tax=Penicillium angulare TaxID=116970 RepID=A0A9W9K0P6_9EURO|nr:hypothetical protein N7456_012086 [Penicillium angulare]